MLEMQRDARALRAKLMNPANAVDDEGIDLKRPKVIPIRVIPSPSEPVKVPRLKPYPVKRRHPSLRDIADVICEKIGILHVDLESSRKQANFVLARHIFCYLSRVMTPHSYPQVGRYLGGRDHTTILHGSRKMEGQYKSDEKIAEIIEAIRFEINRRFSVQNNLYCFDNREI